MHYLPILKCRKSTSLWLTRVPFLHSWRDMLNVFSHVWMCTGACVLSRVDVHHWMCSLTCECAPVNVFIPISSRQHGVHTDTLNFHSYIIISMWWTHWHIKCSVLYHYVNMVYTLTNQVFIPVSLCQCGVCTNKFIFHSSIIMSMWWTYDRLSLYSYTIMSMWWTHWRINCPFLNYYVNMVDARTNSVFVPISLCQCGVHTDRLSFHSCMIMSIWCTHCQIKCSFLYDYVNVVYTLAH